MHTKQQAGFSLIELLIAVTILMIISGAVTGGLLQLTSQQKTITNRTQLHAGVRSATELLQQEVGQSGRISLPGTTTLASNVATGTQTVGLNMKINGATCGSNNVAVACVAGVFQTEYLVIDTGANKESVQITGVDIVAKTITAVFTVAHAANASVNVYGGFASGIVPNKYCSAPANCTTAGGSGWLAYPNGSDDYHLKLFGDVNGDGNMVYVEYTCDVTSGVGKLYRNQMAWDAPSKSTLGDAQVLLGNITANPSNDGVPTDYVPCFTYMPQPLQYLTSVTDAGCACTQSFVLDVAITLTVNTQQKDPTTQKVQTETKALLNVSPRNIFDVWQMASATGAYVGTNNDRIQSMPSNIKNNLLACIDHCTVTPSS